MLASLAQVVGILALLAGVAVLSIPAAVAVAGLGLLIVGVLMERRPDA